MMRRAPIVSPAAACMPPAMAAKSICRPHRQRSGGIDIARPSAHGAVTFDAGSQHLVDRAPPPIALGENLDLDRAVISHRLDETADVRNVDDAVAHHAAIQEKIGGGNE